MARDYNKLDAFHLADDFAVLVYEETRQMSDRDNFRAQLRRAATSAPQNILRTPIEGRLRTVPRHRAQLCN